ncbi:MAG: hypothetical protein M5U28_18435 [Sandaracinaceae bacterium]|nr:hypothetical protein [Sandaracinaceae bacterium]
MNDECAGALEIEARPFGSTVVRGSAPRATLSYEACDLSGRDVFYRFELAERSIVSLYADGGLDVYAAFLESCGEPLARCTTDCLVEGGTLEWHHVEVLDPGVHYVIVGDFEETEDYVVRLGVLPIGDTPAAPLPPGSATLTGTLGGNARGTCGAGARHAYYFAHCTPIDVGIYAASCGATSTVLELYTDVFTVPLCGAPGSSCAGDDLAETIPGSTSFGVLFVEGVDADASGDFTLMVSR